MKNALVTGASTGIGRATAVSMAKAGYHVYLVARSEERLNETKKLIEDNGGSAEVLVVDLSNIQSINESLISLKNKVSEMHAIVNIAGIWHGTDEVFAGTDFEKFDQKVILDTYNVGFAAPTLIVHALLPLMKPGAKIANLSGTFENGAKGWLPYFASKRAIEDLTVGLSQELEDKKIMVNCVSPSDTATEQYGNYFPQYIPDAIEPEKIADKIVELCSDDNKLNGKIIVMKKDTEPFEDFHY